MNLSMKTYIPTSRIPRGRRPPFSIGKPNRTFHFQGAFKTAVRAGTRPAGVSTAWGPAAGVPARDPRAGLPRVSAPRGLERTTGRAGPPTLPSLPRLLPRSFGAAIAPAGDTSPKACSSSSSIIHAHPPRLAQRLQEPLPSTLPSALPSTAHEAPRQLGQRAPISHVGVATGLVSRVPVDPWVAGVRPHGVPTREPQSSDESESDSWTGPRRRAGTTATTTRRRRKRRLRTRHGQREGQHGGTGRGLVRTHAEEIPVIDAFFDQPLPALT